MRKKKILYKYFDVKYKFKINRPKYFFYDFFSIVIKLVKKKRVYGNAKKFLPCNFMEVSWVPPLFTTTQLLPV